jgi:hypothetical protein
MYTKDLDVYFRPPGVVQQMSCRVCGTVCAVTRGVRGPTCYAEALARRSKLHDRFECPHAGEPWHEQASSLCSAITAQPSRRLANVMRQELLVLRTFNLPREDQSEEVRP